MKIKDKIIEATIEIIQNEHDFNGITIRKIAKNAGIGVGLINYHFQTKENLINTAVRKFISGVIAGWNDVLPPPESDSKVELLTIMFQAGADFLATYPRISRVSILNDLNNPNLEDNTMDTLKGVLPILKSFNSSNAVQSGLEVIALLQWRFLRNDIGTGIAGFDFFNEKDRHKFVQDICVEKFTRFEKTKGAKK